MFNLVKSGRRLSISLLTLSIVACGAQDPAFDEEKTQSKIGHDEAVVDPKGGSGNINDTGTSVDGENPDGDGPGSTNNDPNSNGGEGTNSAENNESTEGSGNEGDPGDENFELELVEMSLTQKGSSKVDILWVVDNSGSMKEEQAYLGSNFDNFITELNNKNTDFQTAITTTDVCNRSVPNDLKEIMCPAESGSLYHQGAFMGNSGHKVLKTGDANLVDLFKSYTDVGVNGSGFEHGLKAVEMAVNKSISGQNESLIRDDAFLAVIVVSDEEDDGIGLGQKDAYSGINWVEDGYTEFKYTDDNLIQFLTGIKGQGRFSISTITGTRGADNKMCTSTHSKPLEEGTQYIKAANKTGGIVQSICSYNWDDSLYEIGKDIQAQISQVPLEKKPAVATIKVKVNGVEVSGWQYVEGINAIKFSSDKLPEPGDSIEIKYYGYKN